MQHKRTFFKLFLFFILAIFISSCLPNKKFVYLQNKGNQQLDSSGNLMTADFDYKLQPGDILYISLSTDDEKLNKVFIPQASGGGAQMGGTGVTGSPMYFTGFSIDKAGNVNLPYVGTIKLAGRTVSDARADLETEISKFFKIFYLQMKVASYSYSILGEVFTPGQYYFNQNKVTILQALSIAGDLRNLADRRNIHLYRQYPEGLKLHIIDLTDNSLISQDFWYIKPNDLIYVVPLKRRTVGDMTSLQSSFGVIAPILTTLLLVVNTYILIQNL
jgi:polysaccharide export outer membrane protein